MFQKLDSAFILKQKEGERTAYLLSLLVQLVLDLDLDLL